MNKLENIYCRFCAEPKNSNKLLDLESDVNKYEETMLKLTYMNVYVDVSISDPLPKTVCLVCYDSLNKAYEFLNKVKEAQNTLCSLFSAENKACSDDDRYDEVPLIAHASEGNVKINLEIKSELKEELDDPNIESSTQDSSNENFDQDINVSDILDAAMCNGPHGAKMTIYAKELKSLNTRISSCWKEYPWMCGFCNIEFLNMDTLRSHAKIVHGKCSAFVCVDCRSGKCDDFASFIEHVKTHRKILRKYCHYCDILVDDADELNSHVLQHFPKTHIPCKSCGEILKKDALQKHSIEFNLAKPSRKPRRKRGVPITVDDLTCKLCNKVYKNPNSLRDHMKLHSKDRKRDYTCDRCGKTFYSKGTLTSHIMSHDKIRPHICRICNKSFLFPNMLRRHVEMHSGVKPFSCELCGRCFRLQYQLKAHKIIHTDAMPYACQYCSKVFRFKQILKNHERQHTGAKPYSCKNCGMEFTNWSNYNKHMKRRHGTDTSKKKITPEGVFPVNPETGQLITVPDGIETEEWKSKIMIPAKRGKKKAIKRDSV